MMTLFGEIPCFQDVLWGPDLSINHTQGGGEGAQMDGGLCKKSLGTCMSGRRPAPSSCKKQKPPCFCLIPH